MICPLVPRVRRILAHGGLMLLCVAVVGWGWTDLSLAESQSAKFRFEDVAVRARKAAQVPFKDPAGEVPDFLLKLDYDQWRDIRFRPEQALWRQDKLPFEVQFFHPGFYYNRIVSINVIDSRGVHPVRFDTAMFDYGKNQFKDKVPAHMGFAGFRLHYPINRKDYRDEVAVFLGASYFRSLGKGQVYGLSARGVAIDTGLESGEEFPYFREFWLQKPGAKDRQLTLYALLDSPSLTGAYQFVIHPGKTTVMTVRCRLFLRKAVAKLGMAPLTSMYFYGEDVNQRPVDDFRPEIHDSDGLLLKDGDGEIIWRPLINPDRLFINTFKLATPAGFGLLQRDQAFDHYQDPEAHYGERPSTWVKPLGDWGPGHVELVQLPTDSEKNDNIVAYWVASEAPAPKGPPLDFSYELHWGSADQEAGHAGGRVVATRSAAGPGDGVRVLLIDFQGGRLAKLPALLPNDAPLKAVVSVNEAGQILESQLFKVAQANIWRLVLQVKRSETDPLDAVLPDTGGQPPLELRAFIRQGNDVLTETWSYAVWP